MIKLICAPMATLSHEGFRKCIESFGGCDEYFTEMINAASLINNGPWEKFYTISEAAPGKTVWQLTGNEVSKIRDAAALLCKKDGIGIDLNMGCSAPQIYKTGAGISWMTKDAGETRELVSEVRHVLDAYQKETGEHKRLSVKCRLGDENFTSESFISFCSMLYENGVELITLHPRTKKEKYRGLPRYEYAELLARELPLVTVYVNGCIKDFNSASFALKKCPSVKGLMIAREAVKKPWIFAELKCAFEAHEAGSSYEPAHTVDREKILLDFIDDVLKYQPEEFHKTRLQRFFSYYCEQFSFGHWFTMRLINSKSTEECIEKIKEYFLHNPDDKFISY